MKKTVLKSLSVLFCFVLISLPVFSSFSAAEAPENAPDKSLVQEARFENMLNHNFVYDEDFYNVSDIVNNSMVALLEYRDAEDDSYIAQDIINSYLFDMYGFKIDDFSGINEDFGLRDGFVYILPRGYAIYEHSVKSVSENEDGTFTCVTDVIVKTHDGCEEDLTAETIFAVNESSAFGYNIVISKFI